MHTLEEIYQRQATLEANQEAIEARLEAIEQQAASQVPEGMVLIPAGDFVMGDTFGEGSSDELPLHTVTVRAFYMGETEVTKTQWDTVHGWAVTNGYAFENAGLGKAGNHPVHTVNWNDCVKWANARSEMEGLSPCYLAETTTGTVYWAGDLAPTVDRYASGYRLPTEAEWEKSARGVDGRKYPWGNDWADGSKVIWGKNSGGKTHPVDRTYNTHRSPYGAVDMLGNVWEWVADW